MAQAVALLAVLLSVSFLEGLWVWLLTASLSELEGQAPPSFFVLALVTFAAWLTSRTLALSSLSLAQRRTILVGGGLGFALLATTVHAGLAVPLQLVIGHHEPDYRGSGVAVGLFIAYLWARGLALAVRANRPQIINHVIVSTFVLANILFLMPLAHPVRNWGLGVVIGSFFAAVLALLLIQTAESESKQLSKAQWFGLTAAAGAGMVVCAVIFTGILANGLPQSIGETFGSVARTATPVTNAALLAVGYAAHYLTLFVLYLKALHGGDPEAVTRSQQEAEQSRFKLENDNSYGPPEIMTLVAILAVVGLFLWWLSTVLSRLVIQAGRRERLAGSMSRVSVREGDLMDGIRDALGRIPGLGSSDGLSGRGADIRRHYRAFQALMARAQLPREAAQTAGEYQDRLGRQLPRARTAIAAISESYEIARYAGPQTPLPDAREMENALREVRSVLQSEELAPPPG
jgi:hypothetical protein